MCELCQVLFYDDDIYLNKMTICKGKYYTGRIFPIFSQVSAFPPHLHQKPNTPCVYSLKQQDFESY